MTTYLLSEEAFMILNPYYVKIELSYYKYGFNKLTFTIKNIEYSIPASLLTILTLYFVRFSHTAASKISTKFQAAPINDDPLLKFEKIARNHFCGNFFKLRLSEIKPQTTRQAFNYVGLSNESQTNMLNLKYHNKN